MKKTLILLLSLLMVLAMFSGCGTQNQGAGGDDSAAALDKIISDGYITMATDAAWAPYEFIGANGEVTGCDVDLANDIAEALGVELKIINASFDTLPTYVQSGEADMILAAMTITEERKETMDFSVPYTVAQQYIVVEEDNNDVTTVEDMAGYKIGTHLGTTGDFLVCDEIDLDTGVLYDTGASYAQYKALPDATLDLKNGTLNAIVCDGPMADNLCAMNDGLKCFELVYADGSSTDEEYGIAVAKGNTALLEKINEVVGPIVEDGTFNGYFVAQTEASSLISESETAAN